MDKIVIVQLVNKLRSKNLTALDIKNANETVVANGLRISDLQTAMYFVNNGDLNQARILAGRAATTLSRLL